MSSRRAIFCFELRFEDDEYILNIVPKGTQIFNKIDNFASASATVIDNQGARALGRHGSAIEPCPKRFDGARELRFAYMED